jgi:hypothetical protein
VTLAGDCAFYERLSRRSAASHARRLAGRPPSAGALIQEAACSVETASFLRYCLLLATDQLLMMVRRQVADLWRRGAMELSPQRTPKIDHHYAGIVFTLRWNPRSRSAGNREH